MSETRVPWEIKYREILTDNPNTIKCNYCEKILSKSRIALFTKHLYEKHQISELTHHPNRECLEKTFNINVAKCYAWCHICGAPIYYQPRGIYLLQNHYEIFHGDNAGLYKTVVKAENGREILNNFILMGKKATCISCELQIDIEHINILTLSTLSHLARHYFSHKRYEDNFFIFDKTILNRFYLFFFLRIS